MDSAVAKKTQDTLGKVIKKPPLTEKLLSKPPFRFLHDIITEVIKNTGFMKGLYTTEEMNSANVKDKEAKINFLQKAIDVVSMVSDSSLSVRPTKIVAGHEPEKTNEFLQMMGKAVLSKKSSTDAVKRVQNGEKPGKSSGESKKRDSRSESRDREKSRDQEKEKSRDQEKEKSKERKDRDGSGKKERDSRDRRKGQQENSGRRKDSSSKGESSEGKRREDSAKKEKERNRSSDKSRERAPKKEEDVLDGVDSGEVDAEDGELPPNRIPRPSSAKGQRRRPAEGEGEDSQDGESDAPGGTEPVPQPAEQMNGIANDNELPPNVTASRRMPRPGSARPAPPKIKKQQDELEDQVARIGSGKQVAHVIVDDGKDQDDEDDTFVVEDTHVPPPNEVDMAPAADAVEDDGEHGGLVRKIMETKKQLEASGSQQTKRPQERSAPIISDAARKKERQLAQKEIEKLRNSIQTLTRSANPLGKIMDYIQEDMDSMQKEREMWLKENREHAIALKREQSITDSEIEPLKSELQKLDLEIDEMVDRISAIKCKILKNDETTQQMLSGISFASR